MCVYAHANLWACLCLRWGNGCLFVFIWRQIVEGAAPRVAMTGQWVPAAKALSWHSSITQNLTLLLSFRLHSATLHLLPHTQFCSTAGAVDKCVSSYCVTCLAQLFCDIVCNCSNQVQHSLAKTINLSSKFLEQLSLATVDRSCSAWFAPQRLGFLSSHHASAACDYIDLSVWLWVWVASCAFKLKHIVSCLYI